MAWKKVCLVVKIGIKPDMSDPQSRKTLQDIQSCFPEYADRVKQVRVGKCMFIPVYSPSNRAAIRLVRAMCKRLLASPVYETYRIEVVRCRNHPLRTYF